MNCLLAFILVTHLAFVTDPPKFGWKPANSEIFTLNPIGKRYFPLSKGRWRIELQAESAIYAGVLTPKQYTEALRLRFLPLTAFKGFACNKISIIEAQTECNIGIPRAVLAIRDKRGPISGAFGITEGAAGAAGVVSAPHTASVDAAAMGAADRKLKDNRIKVTFYRWECIENCPAKAQ